MKSQTKEVIILLYLSLYSVYSDQVLDIDQEFLNSQNLDENIGQFQQAKEPLFKQKSQEDLILQDLSEGYDERSQFADSMKSQHFEEFTGVNQGVDEDFQTYTHQGSKAEDLQQFKWEENPEDLIQAFHKKDFSKDQIKKDPNEAFEKIKNQETIFSSHNESRQAYHEAGICSNSELYVGVLKRTGNAGTYNSLTPSDLEIYDKNRYTYYTGTYDSQYNNFGYESCFILYVDERANYMGGIVLDHSPNQARTFSQCNSLTITPDEKVVAVGYFYTQTAGLNPAIAAGYGAKTSALIVYTSLTLGSQIVKIWSASQYGEAIPYFQQATDVTTTMDGSIYITGFTGGWSTGGQKQDLNCFVLRLDSNLDVVYAKSFGSISNDEKCYQIKMSRNFDYIYLGGDQVYSNNPTYPDNTRLLFIKLTSGYGDTVSKSSYLYTNDLTSNLRMRRMFLTNPRDVIQAGAEVATQKIYFCASYFDGTQYDVVFGELTRTFGLNFMFKYGAPTDDDILGDCGITNDARYIILTFGTKHYKARNQAIPDIQNEFVYTYPAGSYASDRQIPYNAFDSCYSRTCCWDYQCNWCCSSTQAGFVYQPWGDSDIDTVHGGGNWINYGNPDGNAIPNYSNRWPFTQTGFPPINTATISNCNNNGCQFSPISTCQSNTYMSCSGGCYTFNGDTGGWGSVWGRTQGYPCGCGCTCCWSWTPGCNWCCSDGCGCCGNNCRRMSCPCCGFDTFFTTSDCKYLTNGCGKCFLFFYYQYFEINRLDSPTIRNYCDTQLYNSMMTYLNEYNVNVYSWHTCQFYTFDYDSIDCSISNLRFQYCIDTNGAGTYTDQNCGHDCYTAEYQHSINQYKPFFTYDYLTWDANYNYQIYNNALYGNNIFQGDVWHLYLCTQSQRTFMPYAFCYTSPNHYYDHYEWIFEQDCDESYTQFSDIFIAKFELFSQSTGTAYVDYQPTEAVYYGHYNGNELPSVMGIDEFGFVYIAGTTDTPSTNNGFGATALEKAMIYLKTHWDLKGELQIGPTNYGTPPRVQSTTTLKSRFIQPKKFKNKYYDDLGNPTSYGITFMSNFKTSVTINSYVTNIINYPTTDSISYDWIPKSINERISSSTEFQSGTHYTYSTLSTYASLDTTNEKFTNFQIELSQPWRYELNKNQNYYFQMNQICDYGIGSASMNYDFKSYYFQIGSLTSLCAQTAGVACGCSACLYNTTTSASTFPYFSGIITNNKGIYYLDQYLGANNYMWFPCNQQTFHGMEYCRGYDVREKDLFEWESLGRYNFGYRPKFIIDDPSTTAPKVLLNIPDQTPTMGSQVILQVSPSTYFTPSSQCVYNYARQGQSAQSTMLPYWMQYYEFNNTFIMYPPSSTTTICVELFCCDAIDQCATNTFYVTPQNNQPVMESSYTPTTFVTYYDTVAGVGQHFQWSKTTQSFTDADTQPTTSNPVEYQNRMADSIYLKYSGALTGFSQINDLGMIYAQLMSTNVYTKTSQPQTIPFKYYDNHMYVLGQTTTLSGSIYIIMDRLPAPTVTGTSYTFTSIDPLAFIGDPSGVFGYIFPWLKGSPSKRYYLDVSSWFTDADSDTLRYSITYSDGTLLPSWFQFNQLSGELTIPEYIQVPSEYMNLKITAYDTKEGYYSYFKTLLIDTAPLVVNPYILIYASVGKSFSYYFGDNVIDQNNDQLSFSVASNSDSALLATYGITFSSVTKIISGTVNIPTFVPNIKVEVTDTYGLTAYIYITITVIQAKPTIRSAGLNSLQDQEIIAGHRFYFTFPDDIFYDPTNATGLLLYPSQITGTAIPTWLKFNPQSYSFTGIAPNTTGSYTIKMTAMQRATSDFNSVQFMVTVIPANSPKTIVQYLNDDFNITQHEWFQVSVPLGLFEDPSFYSIFNIHAAGSSGQALPDWLTYSKFNRTLFGKADTPGTYIVDFIYTDQVGAQTFSNVRITVNPIIEYRIQVTLYFFLTCSLIAGFLIYMIYVWQFGFTLIPARKNTRETNRKIAKEALKRFGKYKEVDMKFYLPESFQGIHINQPTVTKDYDFLGIDATYKGNQMQGQQPKNSARRHTVMQNQQRNQKQSRFD